MSPIEIPFATQPIRLLMGFLCAFFAVGILWFVVRGFVIYLRRLSTLKWSTALAGAIIYVLMFGFALIPAAIFVELVQNPKTIISDAGISLDATLLHGSTRIGWNEIQRVTCLWSRSRQITSLTIHGVDGRKITVGNSGIAALGPVHDLLVARLGNDVVERCWIPFRQ
jgi:hypothetical protein